MVISSMVHPLVTHNATIGELTIPTNPGYICYTLEDKTREQGNKVYGETAIPCGRYEIALRTEGAMHEKYKARFPWHKGMLWLKNVPGFEYIYIHIGNDVKDSLGCILTASSLVISPNGVRCINSTDAYKILYEQCIRDFSNGNPVTYSKQLYIPPVETHGIPSLLNKSKPTNIPNK